MGSKPKKKNSKGRGKGRRGSEKIKWAMGCGVKWVERYSEA